MLWLAALSCIVSIALGNVLGPPPFVLAQPLPCVCLNLTNNGLLTTAPNSTQGWNSTLTCSQLLESQNGTRCGYPFPTNLGLEGRYSCEVAGDGSYYWRVIGDVFIPNNVLADFCTSDVTIVGSLLLPPSSNISQFRQVNGSSFTANPYLYTRERGATAELVESGVTASGIIYAYGRLLLVMSNFTTATFNNITNATRIPANGTSLQNLWNFGSALDSSNQTQLWQGAQPNIQCQTITQSPTIKPVDGQVFIGVNTKFFSQSITLTVFNQCNYDAYVFIVVVATVGGALIAGAVIYAVIAVILGIRKSMNAAHEAPKYVEMER